MWAMDLDVFVTPGLGDNSFLVVSGDEAAVVDPQRDAWRFVAAAEQRHVAVRAVLETHVHNDYISGAHEVRAATGAELVLPADGGYAFDHRGAREGEEVRVGDLRIVAMDTPGHTFEHIAWVVHEGDADVPVAVFTGGSLLVGSAGRTDLLGPDHTAALTAAQFATVRRLAGLPDDTRLLPTHGAGSFCVSAMPSTARTSTLGAERIGNDLLLASDEREFAAELTGELMAYPAYYRQMAPINRAGTPVLGGVPAVPALTGQDVRDLVARGTAVVDARDRDTFAAGHIPGALNIELNSGFGSYVGWVLPFDSPLVLVLPDPVEASAAEAMTQLLRIGWRTPAGHLAADIAAWTDAGGQMRSYPSAGPQELCEAITSGAGPRILDVRQELEWAWGVLPGSQTIFVADLPGRIADVPAGDPVWVVCSNGHRAAIAASMLDAAGVRTVMVGSGGVGEVRQRCAAQPAGARD
jgi:glyoxylase-like metal-dependent hydrolase (beta-lactamase superfamily II)/rhodanese-related sulfurtransferase